MTAIGDSTRIKTCTKCGECKPATQDFFTKHTSARDGMAERCKLCRGAAYAAWASANKEKVRANSAAWASAHPEKIKASAAVWAAANRDKGRARSATWRAENKDAVVANKHNRRARQLGNGGTLSSGLKERLIKLQRGLCACCSQPLGDKPHLDHIMPLALGGTNTDDNMQLLQSKCNLQKNAKHPVDYMQSRGFLL